MKKLILLVVIAAAAGGGYYYYSEYGKTKEKPQVIQALVSQGRIQEIVQATGSLTALRTVNVGSQVSGIVTHLYADFNSIVHKGEVIAELDPSLLQVQVDTAQANLERQQGEIASQEVQYQQSQRDLDRTKALFAQGLQNQQVMDQSELTTKTRATSLESAKKQLKTTQASLDQAKLNLSYTVIKSPIDGVVVSRQVDEGQAVQSSMNVAQFFVIATDLRVLKLTAGVDEAEVGKIRKDMPVTFEVDSYKGQVFSGTVEAVRLNATSTQNVVTYPVWINAPNPDLKLRPSMTATIKIIVSEAAGVIRIPNQATRFRPTPDIYTALGLTPPTGQGRALAGGDAAGGGTGRRGGNRGGGAPGAGAAAEAPADASATAPPVAGPGTTPGAAATAPAPGGRGAQGQVAEGQTGQRQRGQQNGDAATRGQNGGRGQGAQGGRGFGQNGQVAGGAGGRGGANFANMTPEQRQQAMQQFGAGRGGRAGRATQAANVGVTPTELNADKIDELFAPVPTVTNRVTVYTWDEAAKKLTGIPVVTGITDGQFSQLVSGDLAVGQQLVTSVLVPQTSTQRNQQNSLFGGPQRGGAQRGGGIQPGGAGGGGAGAGGFGGGGGGAGGGGGGGGGGRGGGE